MKKLPTITPNMELAHFAATTGSDKITIKARFGKIVSLNVYDYSGSPSEWVDLYSANAWGNDFTREMCNEWIFAANQAIEQYVAAQEMALCVAA